MKILLKVFMKFFKIKKLLKKFHETSILRNIFFLKKIESFGEVS